VQEEEVKAQCGDVGKGDLDLDIMVDIPGK
jgi:hypothetical protein